MPKFELYIPAADDQGFNITFRVDAPNWMAALKTGMRKIGEQGATGKNVLVDVQDDSSVHVTEPVSGRVFQIRELTDVESATVELKKPAAPPPAPPPDAEPPKPVEAKPEPSAPEPAPAVTEAAPVVTSRPLSAGLAIAMVTEGRPTHVSAGGVGLPVTADPTPLHQHEIPSERGEAPTIPIGRTLSAEHIFELERPVKPVTGRIGRAKATSNERSEMEDVLAEVFERVADVSREPSADKAMYFLLDLALEKIKAESGSVLRADGANGDLTFLAARGPKAAELLDAKLVIPHGVGIAGFCSNEGVCVALSDVQRDPRFYPGVSERLNYTTKSVLTAPMMTHGRAFGCFQVINKLDAKPFSAPELGILSYLAHQAALYLNDRA